MLSGLCYFTGGSSGYCLATVNGFKAKRYTVIITARRKQILLDAQKQILK